MIHPVVSALLTSMRLLLTGSSTALYDLRDFRIDVQYR